MKKSKIRKVYVAYDWDPDIEEEYLSAILVIGEKEMDTSLQAVPDYYLKLNPVKKLKFQDKLYKILVDLKKVSVIEKFPIEVDTSQARLQIEKYGHIFDSIYDFSRIVKGFLPLICSIEGIGYFFLAGVSFGSLSSVIAQNIKSSKAATELNRFKLLLSATILGLNIAVGAKNFSFNMDALTTQVYSIQRHALLGKVENPFSDGNVMVTDKDAAVNLLMDAFALNPLLDEEDRKVASSLRQYFLDNPYLDYEKIYDRYSSFGILDFSYKGDRVSAAYSRPNNLVFNYVDKDGKTAEQYRSDLCHELIHVTGNLDCAFLNEGMTSLLNSEYVNDFQATDGYYDQLLITKCLCEIIGPDKMLEAYLTDNMNIIKEELLKLNPDVYCYEQLLKEMDTYHRKHFKRDDYDYISNSRSKFINALLPYLENVPSENFIRIGEYFQLLNTFDYDAIPKFAYYNHEGFAKENLKIK